MNVTTESSAVRNTFALALVLAMLSGEGAVAQEHVLRVVTTLPVLADLVRQVGGDEVSVRALAKGGEDPHYVVPTPSLMAAVNRADLFVEVGLSLELWAENVLDGARNARIRRGAAGHVFACKGVVLKERPSNLTRARGDLHPEGNPHIWMDPVNLPVMAENVTHGLETVAPGRKDLWRSRLQQFRQRWDRFVYGDELVKLLGGRVLGRLARGGKLWSFLDGRTYKGSKLSSRLGGWLGRMAPLRGRGIVFQHQSWAYLADRLGLDVEGYIEEKPGIPPSAAHKEALIRHMRERGVKLVGILTYYDDTAARVLARETGARVVVLPGNVDALPETADVGSMMDVLASRLLAAVKER